MSARQRFWQEFFDLKVHSGYLGLYLGLSERIDRAVNIGVAVVSTSSLGIWAFLKQFEVLWAGLIVVSQIVAVVKRYFPYQARVKALGSSVHEFEEHLLWVESKWFEIADGKLTEQEINQARLEIKKRKHKTMKSHFSTSTLPQRPDLLDSASKEALTFFSTYYPVSTNDS